jgi:hypothetical protein
MNLGATLKAAEKVFGPALPGRGDEDKTLSAVHYAAGKGKKFAGVAGVREDAVFHIHFPTRVEWTLLRSKKGTPDFINDLKPSGPQGEQGRERLVAEFLERYEKLREKLRLKEETAAKKTRAAQWKKDAEQKRQNYVHWVGEREATITVGSESLTLPLKITRDKSGKIKIAGVI